MGAESGVENGQGLAPMRDIRDDLRDRIAGVEGRYAELNAKYDEQRQRLQEQFRSELALLDQEKDALTKLIMIESERVGQPAPPPQAAKYKLPLADFFITKIHAIGPLSKEELREHADLAGYFEGKDGVGRIVHTTLMNVTSAGKLKKLPDDRYAFPQADGPSLFAAHEPEDGAMQTVM